MSTSNERQPRAAGLIGILQFAAALSSFVIAPASAQERSGAQPRSLVSGIVRDSMAGAPVVAATITIYGTTAQATTDQSGRFTLDSVPLGTRVLQVIALGYKPRLVAVGVQAKTPEVSIRLVRTDVVLDSMRVTAIQHPEDMPRRKRDVIEEKEFQYKDVASGSALDALALLRPQLFAGRHGGGLSPTTEAAMRSQFYVRDVIVTGTGETRVVCQAGRACDIDPRLSVSINGGPVGSPDILSVIPARIIREMRYLLPVDAVSRFGQTAGGGPVLVVYTK